MSKALRINFELDRADNPPLYDELARFAKGAKRVNRLRTLAHAGLMAQTKEPAATSTAGLKETSDNIDPVRSAATLELFGPSVS